MNNTYYVRIEEYNGTYDESVPEVLATSYSDEFVSRRGIKDLEPIDVIGYGVNAENLAVHSTSCMSFDVYESDENDLNLYRRVNYITCDW